jgi:serine/threonine protein kinase
MQTDRLKSIGKYEILEILGRGGMGVVYRARDKRIGRDVAIKMLTDGFAGNSEMLARFYLEAGHTGTLRHPNIVTVYDVSDQEGTPYIVMEYLDGTPLDRLIQQGIEGNPENDAFDLGMRLEVVDQVCSALAYAHRQGVIHRDVKPANVILQRDGTAKLLDFGIARAERRTGGADITRTGLLIGTPPYMAPERLRNEPFDGRSDIFAAGVLLYQLLTGVLPFSDENNGILDEILHKNPPPLSKHLRSYPAQLDEVIARALAKSPNDRYVTADEMAAELKNIAGGMREQRVSGLIDRAQDLIRAEQFGQAQQALLQVLRIDSQHLRGKQMLSELERRVQREQQARRVARLCQQGEDLLVARDWEQARSLAAEALKLDPGNERAQRLSSSAEEGRLRKEQINRLLLAAEAARRAGKYDEARKQAFEAAHLDGENSKIHALCTLLDQEAEVVVRRQRVDALRSAAEHQFEAGRYEEALQRLQEAEALAPQDTGLHRLRDEVASAMAQEGRRRITAELKEEVQLVFTLEQAHAVAERVDRALANAGTDSTLLRLRAQIQQKLAELERHRAVEEAAEACRCLPPEEAMACVARALEKAPGNARLLELRAGLEGASRRSRQEQYAAEKVAQAHAGLAEQRYPEAIAILESCEREGRLTAEMAALLDTARAGAAETERRERQRASLALRARQLDAAGDFEGVTRLLDPATEQWRDEELSGIYQRAKAALDAQTERENGILRSADRLIEMGLYAAAVAVLQSQPEILRRSGNARGLLQRAEALEKSEEELFAGIGSAYAEIDRASSPDWQALEGQARQSAASGPALALLAGLRRRRARVCDAMLMPAVEAAAAGRVVSLAEFEAWIRDASPAMQAKLSALAPPGADRPGVPRIP